jgi:hypothetical protein
MLCPRCKTDRAVADWYSCATSRTGYQYYCRPCSLELKRLWRENDPTTNRTRALRYYHEHRADVLKKKYEAYWQNPESHRAAKNAKVLKNPDLYRTHSRNAHKRKALLEPHFFTNKVRRRDAMKQKALPSWADKNRIEMIYKEAKRLEQETGVAHHVDHIVPLNSPLVCGLHNEFNLQAIPLLDNVRKSNRVWPDMP